MQSSPQYFYESISGVIGDRGGRIELGLEPDSLPGDVRVAARGEFVLRYGIEFLRRPHALVPGLFIAESGATKVGREAWDWLWSKFQLYPRAEIVGMRTDGQSDHVFLRELDFGRPPSVWIFSDSEDWTPLGQVSALYTGGSLKVPDLLGTYLG